MLSLKSGKEMFSKESDNRMVSAVANAGGIREDMVAERGKADQLPP